MIKSGRPFMIALLVLLSQTVSHLYAQNITVRPNKLFYLPGERIDFLGEARSATGQPVKGLALRIDDPVAQRVANSTTDSKGQFKYSTSGGSNGSRTGLYVFGLFGGASPVFVTLDISPMETRREPSNAVRTNLVPPVFNKNHLIPLGTATAAPGTDMASAIKLGGRELQIRPGPHVQPASMAEMTRTATTMLAGLDRFRPGQGSVSPLHKYLAITAVSGTEMPWGGYGALPCTAVYSFLEGKCTQSDLNRYVNEAIERSNLLMEDRRYWKNESTRRQMVFFSIDSLNAVTDRDRLPPGLSSTATVVKYPTRRSTDPPLLGLTVVTSNVDGTVCGFKLY